MLDALPRYQSMKRPYRVRKFQPRNSEHGWHPRRRRAHFTYPIIEGNRAA